jgi:hypothetical protein
MAQVGLPSIFLDRTAPLPYRSYTDQKRVNIPFRIIVVLEFLAPAAKEPLGKRCDGRDDGSWQARALKETPDVKLSTEFVMLST